MTICVAALAKENEKEYIVFAADHMVTTDQGQFEHSITKYKEINGSTVAMLSGIPLFFDELIKLDDFDCPFDEIKFTIFQNFKNKKRELIKNEVFDQLMIDEDFFVEALKQPVPNNFVGNMLETVAKYSLNTGILLIGIEHNKGKISVIDEIGCHDITDINFHAIGSGSDQAANTLLFQKHSDSENLSTAVYNVYKAKRNAEVKQGVGKETELCVLCEDKLVKLQPIQIDKLAEIYDKELKYGKKLAEEEKICFGDKEE